MRAPPASNKPDDRCAIAQRHVLYLGDLLRMRLGQRAAENGKILGEDKNRAAIDSTPAGNDAIAGNLGLLVHAEIRAAMLHEHVEFLERAVIEQKFDPLTRCQLAALVLGIDPRLSATKTSLRAALFE